MRKTHEDFIDRWTKFMTEHPTRWKNIHTKFINAQFQKHDQFLKRLLQEPNGRQKIIELYDIKNRDGFKKLLA